MIPAPHADALRLLIERLPVDEINWALTGSTGHALQGVPVEVHDIDVQTDEDGAWRAANRLVEYCVSPLCRRESETIRSLLGRYVIQCVDVELIGALQKCAPGGGWGAATDPGAHRRFVTFEGLRVPVLELGYEARAYFELGRYDRAELLGQHVGQESRESPIA